MRVNDRGLVEECLVNFFQFMNWLVGDSNAGIRELKIFNIIESFSVVGEYFVIEDLFKIDSIDIFLKNKCRIIFLKRGN